jgi:hypothetical protein
MIAGEEITFSYISHRSIQFRYDMLTIQANLWFNWKIVCPPGKDKLIDRICGFK